MVAGRYAPGSGPRGGDRGDLMRGGLFEKHEAVFQNYTLGAFTAFESGRHPEPAGSGFIPIVLTF